MILLSKSRRRITSSLSYALVGSSIWLTVDPAGRRDKHSPLKTPSLRLRRLPTLYPLSIASVSHYQSLMTDVAPNPAPVLYLRFCPS